MARRVRPRRSQAQTCLEMRNAAWQGGVPEGSRRWTESIPKNLDVASMALETLAADDAEALEALHLRVSVFAHSSRTSWSPHDGSGRHPRDVSPAQERDSAWRKLARLRRRAARIGHRGVSSRVNVTAIDILFASNAAPEGWRIIDDAQLMNVDPTFLVDGMIPDRGLSVLHGPSGTAKTTMVAGLQGGPRSRPRLAWARHPATRRFDSCRG